MFDRKLLDILACVKCRGDLEYVEDEEVLVCKKCGHTYEIIDGIPRMIISEEDEEK